MADFETILTNPKKAAGDGQSVEMYDLKDQIEADRYAKANTANAVGKMPIRLIQLKPGGTL